MIRFHRPLASAVLVVLTACSGEPPTPPSGTDAPRPGLLPAREVRVIPQIGVPAELEPAWEFPPLQTELPRVDLEISSSEYSAMLSNVTSNVRRDAEFRADGFRTPIQMRLRGASARHFPKKSYKVYFPDGVRWQGRTKLNLVAEYQDATMMAEKFAYDLLAAMRVRAPRATYVRLYLNGRYQGVYLDIEQVDKRFLRSHEFADLDGNIYRCGWKDCEMKTWQVPYQGDWAKKTNETEPDDDLHEFLCMVNHTPEPVFAATLAERLELESYLRSMVMDTLTSNNFVEDSESFLVHDRLTGKWSYVPWDLNNVDSRWWVGVSIPYKPKPVHPIFSFSLLDGWTETMYQNRKDKHPGYLPVYSNLHTRVVFNADLRERLLVLFERAFREVFEPSSVQARIDAMYALLEPHMKDDPYIDFAKFQAAKTYFKNFFTGRDTFVRAELDKFRARGLELAIEAVDPRAGWIELKNHGTNPVDLGGRTLTTNLRRPFGRNLPSRRLEPGQSVRLEASRLGLT
ncbi:MAG: CotH kinase family protein, partial [Myxococcales bacterium]